MPIESPMVLPNMLPIALRSSVPDDSGRPQGTTGAFGSPLIDASKPTMPQFDASVGSSCPTSHTWSHVTQFARFPGGTAEAREAGVGVSPRFSSEEVARLQVLARAWKNLQFAKFVGLISTP